MSSDCFQEVKNNGKLLKLRSQKVVIVTYERWAFTRCSDYRALTENFWHYVWMVAYRGWWLTRVADTWRYLACEEPPGELAQSLGGFLQLLYYLSHVSYKLQKSLVLCFSKIVELLKIAHEKRNHF